MKKVLKSFLVGLFVLALNLAVALPVLAQSIRGDYNSLTGGVNLSVGSRDNYNGGGGWSLSNPYGLPSGSLLGILTNLLYWLLAVFAIGGIIAFVISGIFYLLAGADEGNAKKGKAGMTAAIVGIIVGLSGFLIMQAVSAFLGGSKTF